MGSTIAEGDDQSHHSFASDKPNQGAQVPQNLFSNSSLGDLATIYPALTSAASPSQSSSSIQPSGILINTPVFSPTNSPVVVSSATHKVIPLWYRFPCSNNNTGYCHIVGTGKYSFCNYSCGIFTHQLLHRRLYRKKILYPQPQCRMHWQCHRMSTGFEKIVDLKMPTSWRFGVKLTILSIRKRWY